MAIPGAESKSDWEKYKLNQNPDARMRNRNAPVDDYEVDEGLIKDMGLFYTGRDEAGNRTWQTDEGQVYVAVQLQKRQNETTRTVVPDKSTNPVLQTNSTTNAAPVLASKIPVLEKRGKGSAGEGQPQESAVESTTIFIDIESGKYLGHLKDYVDTDTEYSFPKLKINVRAIPRLDFGDIKRGYLSIQQANDKSLISQPVQIDFEKIKSDIKNVINGQFEYDKNRQTNVSFTPHEEALIIYFSPKKIVDTKDISNSKYAINSITSTILPNRVNCSWAAFALNVYVCVGGIASRYVTKGNIEYAGNYFIQQNHFPDPMHKVTPEQVPPDLKLPRDEKAFLDQVKALEQFVICDCHTHPNLLSLENGNETTVRNKSYSEPSNNDDDSARLSGLPDIILRFDRSPLKTSTMLSRIYIVTKQKDHFHPQKDILNDPKVHSDSSAAVMNTFLDDIESILLNDIIKQYYEEAFQPN